MVWCGVCCVCASSTSAWLGTGNVQQWTAKTTPASLELCVLSSGRRMMASLGTYQACSPAEDLQTSQGRKHFAHRVSKARKKFEILKVGTWNVRSMVDTEGTIEVASQSGEREHRKVDQIVCELARHFRRQRGLGVRFMK